MRTESERMIREALDILNGKTGPYLPWKKVELVTDILHKVLQDEPVGRDSAWNLAERSGQHSR